ncbi:MAG: hypothetical protein H7833_16955 [Magnetococcus sp. DMHC-1]|nr:hypothetical protein [Magnetococcales bacterium]
MSDKAKTNSWVVYCQDLARLRLELERVEQDHKFRKSGGKILYIVDADVVSFYANPVDNEKYIHVFREDKHNLRSVAYLMADFLFFDGRKIFTDNSPLYILPPHLDEVLYNVEVSSKKTVQKAQKAVRQVPFVQNLLDRCAEDLEKTGSISDKSIDSLVSHVPDLMDVMHGGICSELERFSRLGSENCLVNSLSSTEIPYFDSDELAIASKQWIDIFHQEVLDDRPEANIHRDAQVLAWLDAANKVLREDAPQLRVHLLTGAESAFRVFNIYRKNETDIQAQKEYLLRHPRQFISLMFASMQDSESVNIINFIELLDRFFYPLRHLFPSDPEFFHVLEIIQNNKNRPTGLMDLLDRSKEKEKNALVQDIMSRWMDILNAACIRCGVTEHSDDQKELVRRLVKFLLREDIDKILKLRIEETISHLESAYSSIGFMAALSELKQNIKDVSNFYDSYIRAGSKKDVHSSGRAPIALRFDDTQQKIFGDYHNQIRLAMNNGEVTKLRKGWSLLTPYMLNLTHAMISAEANKWDICRDYCLQAYHDARRDLLEFPHEAAYFLAVACRHHYRGMDDFRDAFKWLDQAKIHWQEAHPNEQDKRLDVEYLALMNVIHNRNAYLENNEIFWNFPDMQDITYVWNSLWDLFQQDDVRSILVRGSQAQSWERRMYRQIILNLCSIYLHHQHVKSLDNHISTEYIDKLNNLFIEYYKTIEKDGESYYSRFIKIAWEWQFNSKQEKYLVVQCLSDYLDKIKQSKIPLLSYEQRKFDFFLARLRELTPES